MEQIYDRSHIPILVGGTEFYIQAVLRGLPKEKRIPGNILLGFALETISSLKYSVGGVMEFLECEDNEFLLSFYRQNHFKPFDTRITASQPFHM